MKGRRLSSPPLGKGSPSRIVKMKKILILSVGGSPEPIINAVKFYQPDFVYFFCSSGPQGSVITIDGPGNPCGDKRKSKCPECGHEFYLGNPKGKAIVFQAGLPKEKYEIVEIEDPDNLDECYLKLIKLGEKIREKYPEGSQVIANYTGGTKTMSVALGLVGVMTQNWDLSLNKGPRLDFYKVRTGDTPVVIDKWRIFCQNQIESVKKALENYNYSLAQEIISEMLSHPCEHQLETKLLRAKQICQAFNEWDKFNHALALEILQPYGKEFSLYIIGLKKILRKIKSTGYEMVSDLLNNAARRAYQHRYDDAVARLYRATELFAQVRLEKEKRYKMGELELGLRKDYELLHEFNDPLGKKFKENERRILDALKRRNLSIGAHGLIPLSEDDYVLVKNILQEFILESAKETGIDFIIPQLPQEEIICRLENGEI